MIATALIAKFLSAGAVAQAAAGAGVVVVVTAGAGTAGVLPGDAQTAFSDFTGISEVEEQPTDELIPSTDEVPLEGEDPLDPADPTPVIEEEPVSDELTEEALWAEGPDEGQPFGEWVSEGARNGWATGAIVTEMAHERNAQRWLERQAAKSPEVEEPEVEAPEAPEDGSGGDEQETAVESADDDRNSKSNGRGNGGGQGRGRG